MPRVGRGGIWFRIIKWDFPFNTFVLDFPFFPFLVGKRGFSVDSCRFCPLVQFAEPNSVSGEFRQIMCPSIIGYKLPKTLEVIHEQPVFKKAGFEVFYLSKADRDARLHLYKNHQNYY